MLDMFIKHMDLLANSELGTYINGILMVLEYQNIN